MTYHRQTGSTSSTTLHDVSQADRKNFVNDVTCRIRGRQETLRQRRHMTYQGQTGKFRQRRYMTYQGQTGSTSSTTLHDVSQEDRNYYFLSTTLHDVSQADRQHFVNDVIIIQCNTIQLYCLCVETFVFWFVICIKHSTHFTIKHSTIQ